MSDAQSRFADRYRLTEALGRGGMGEVWRAFDERLNRYCAVKVLRQMEDDAGAERFSREARTLASLRHPGVVTVYDYGVDAGRPYLVMQLLPGPSLAELLREQGPLEIEAVRRYGAQAAGALQAVHEAGVVHRDLKPANVVLDDTGAARLVDFGIALGGTVEAAPLTEHGTILGSASYLAPEQAVGSRADARSDLYGFGCLLMALLTGKPPFDDDMPVEILGRHLNDAPPRPSDRRADIPPDLDALVLDLLAKAPENRPPDAAEVARRLSGGRGGRSSPGPVPMPARDTGATAVLTPPPPPPGYGGDPAGRRRTNRTLVVVLALLAVLAAAVGAWALTRPDDAPREDPLPVPSIAPEPAVTDAPVPTDLPDRIPERPAPEVTVPEVVPIPEPELQTPTPEPEVTPEPEPEPEPTETLSPDLPILEPIAPPPAATGTPGP